VALKSERPPPPRNSVPPEPPPPRRSSAGVNWAARISELEAELTKERKVSAALREVGIALGTTLDLDQLLELVLGKITDALEAERATLYLLDEAKNELVSRVTQGDAVKQIRLKVGDGIAGHVAESGKTLLVKDAYKDSRFDRSWDLSSGYRTRSILAVPMKNHLGRTIGVVQVLNKINGEFSDLDAVVLAALATQAAISIDNSRLFLSVTQKNMQLMDTKEQLEHRVRDLKLLFDLESALGRAASLEEMFKGVLIEALVACEARAGAFALRDANTGYCTLYFMDEKSKRLKSSRLRAGQGFVGYAMETNEAVLSNEAREHEAFDPTFDEVFGFPLKSVLAVPLEGEDDSTVGAIALYNKHDILGFGEEERALLLLIAANASTAMMLHFSRDAREREERLTTIGRLLSGVVHDLKTPLSVISGYVQLMAQTQEQAKRSEYADLALRQFDHIVAMQRDVLEFARGEKSVFLRKVYLAPFFEDIRKQLETDLGKKRVELVIELADKGTARFDEGKVTRVIHNLARNAAEAMGDKGGRFTIRVSRDQHDALIMTFADTGPGIPKEIEHRLFQSFVTSGKKGGTGLGLAITKRVAEEHGGSISVRSSSKGATFKLRLPQVGTT
jgi:signal transduction histidine kinase/putative methionine-R-sulfoxide reductase with GAF domain